MVDNTLESLPSGGVKTFFPDDLRKKLAANPAMFAEINAVFLFNITFVDGSTQYTPWTVDFSQGGTITQEAHPNPDCTVSMGPVELHTLITQPHQALRLFVSGKVKVDNVGLASNWLPKIFG